MCPQCSRLAVSAAPQDWQGKVRSSLICPLYRNCDIRVKICGPLAFVFGMADDWSEKLVNEVCNTLKEQRLSLGITIYQVAQRSGVSWQSISAYEKHTRRPTLDCLAKVAVALDLRASIVLEKAESKIFHP